MEKSDPNPEPRLVRPAPISPLLHLEDFESQLSYQDLKPFKEFWFHIVREMFLNPSLSFSRMTWGDLLHKLLMDEQEQKEMGIARPDLMAVLLRSWLTTFGLLSETEARTIAAGGKVENIDPSPKYLPWTELVDRAQAWKKKGETIGLVHGSFDPVHIGHGNLFARTWPYCDRLLVGFDGRKLTEAWKGRKERFPLAARMWEAASLPVVDMVYRLPFEEVTDDEYAAMYRDLGIKVLGTSSDNKLLETYRKRMQEVGGVVLSDPHLSGYSSSMMMKYLANSDIQARLSMRLTDFKAEAEKTAEKAMQAGFLRD